MFILRIFIITYILICLSFNSVFSQCYVNVDTANIGHIICPNGGSVGSAQIVQATYLNYSWQNVTNGQLYNGGGGNGGTFRTDLDAGYYVITASSPYSSSCPDTIYSDTFKIRMPIVDIQPLPSQACPNECNVSVNLNLTDPISPNIYTYSIDNLSILPIIDPTTNLCGGNHTYDIFVNGSSCGVSSFGISQFAELNLSTSIINATCSQLGSASVNITGVGASGLNTYCLSSAQYDNYSTINNVIITGDNNVISNNTSNICNTYSDFTSLSIDVTPANTYSLQLDIGTCHTGGFALTDIAKVYIDWNIDGDFDDVDELVSQIPPTQSPSSNMINFTVPSNAVPGQSRMRIVVQNQDYQPNNQANSCDYNTSWFGETEDYTIIVNGSVATPVSYLWSNGQTTQTADNLSAGTYYVTITDANGCEAIDTAVITGVSNVSVNASGSQTICNGAIPNPLSATSNISGSYSWFPAADFVDPNVQNPIFTNGLTTTTTYTVVFSVPGCTVTDNVTISVNPVPLSSLSVFPNPACYGDNLLLTANSSIPVGLYRFQFSNNSGATWFNITSPLQWTSINPFSYPNITSLTQFRVKVKEGNGCNASSWSNVIVVPANIIITPSISHN